jgi:hypothetical protein
MALVLSIVHFEALEQTLRLRLVSGPVDKKFFYFSRNSLSRTVSSVINSGEGWWIKKSKNKLG